MARWGWTHWSSVLIELSGSETQTLLDAEDKLGEVRRMFHNPPLLDNGQQLASYFWIYPLQIRFANSGGNGVHVWMTGYMWFFNFFWWTWVTPRGLIA